MNIPLNIPTTIKLITTTPSGTRIKTPATILATTARIEFLKSPFSLKDEIKAMRHAQWHGYQDPPRKIWSVENCLRNWFQLQVMMGEDAYAWFDRPIQNFKYERPLRGHQKDMSDAGLTYHYQIFGAEMGLGKGGLPSTKVATPTGWTTLGEIRAGDYVINPAGGKTRVIGVYHRGQMPMFRVTFSDGSSVVCSEDHLWNVRSACQKHRGQDYQTLELKEILLRGLTLRNGNAKHYIPMVAPVTYTKMEQPVDPYVVGYLLGNGSLSGWNNKVSIPDVETVARLNSLILAPLKFSCQIDYIIKDQSINKWILAAKLKGCRSWEKHIPDQYLYGSVDQRIALLQGLCDSDGYAADTGVEYSTTSKVLCESVVTLVQSLGGTCHIHTCYPTYTYKNKVCTGRLAYRIYISLPVTIFPFRLSRKVKNYVVPTKYQPTRAITKVESIGEDECICISVAAKNQLYVTDEYIVTHNTLSAMEVMEKSGKKLWWWVGPKSGLYAVEREFKKWEISPNLEIELMTYEGLVKRMGLWKPRDLAPMGVVFDEISRAKTAKTQRTQAAQALADGVRRDWNMEGFVLGMSGTPSPKSPVDWWSPCEIVWPGFLREGDADTFKFRLGIHRKEEGAMGNAFWQLVDWRDNEKKCDLCGELEDEGKHSHLIGTELTGVEADIHDFQPSKNEVAYLSDRLKGLVIVKQKKDCLDLPEKQYRQVYCKPSPATLRVAAALMQASPNTITGLTKLRELSDGFQYRDKIVGKEKCPICDGSCKNMYWIDPEDSDHAFTMTDMLDPEYVATLVKTELTCTSCNGTGEVDKVERTVKEVPCPKEEALVNLLDENEETGRLVVFAAFTGSIDRCTKVCLKHGWDVIRVDGRGWLVYRADGQPTTEAPLDYWAETNKYPRVAFVAHPRSGGMSLTLVEARMVVYYSNDFAPESRSQSEDRIHRLGMDTNKGATIVDLLHLPTDKHVLEILQANRRLELMSMGMFIEAIENATIEAE